MYSWRSTTEQHARLTTRITCCALRCSLLLDKSSLGRGESASATTGWTWRVRSLYEGRLFVWEVSVAVNSHISISRCHWSLDTVLIAFIPLSRLIRFFPVFYDSALIAFNLCEFYLMSLLATVHLTLLLCAFSVYVCANVWDRKVTISSPLFL